MTADERALLMAVCADPDADLPRLVYADWLDDLGRPERAELVRLAVALERLPLREQAPPDPHAKALYDRQATLWPALVAWQAELRALLPPNKRAAVRMIGNVPVGLDCTAKYLTDHGTAVAAVLPVAGLWLRKPSAGRFREAAGGPVWAGVRRLRLDPDQLDVAGLDALLSVPPPGLGRLAVTGAVGFTRPTHAPTGWLGRSVDLIVRLYADPVGERLTVLDLDAAGIGVHGADLLAKSRPLAGLRLLNVAGNHLPAVAATRLRERFGRRVRVGDGQDEVDCTIGELLP